MTILIPVTVEIPIDGVWADITSYVYTRDEITISRGRADEASQVEASSCQLTLNNRDGRFSPRNPLSPYYGKIGRNTPLRVSIEGASELHLGGVDGYVSTPDNAALDITGDIDLRIRLKLGSYIGSTYYLIGKWEQLSGSQQSYLFSLRDDGTLRFWWTTNGTDGTEDFRISDEPVPTRPNEWVALRVTVDVNNGAGGADIKFWTSDSLDGTWTQLGTTKTTGGTISLFSGTAPLVIGSRDTSAPTDFLQGHISGARVYNGIAGTAVANPDFTAEDPGTTSFADAAGRTWTLNGDAEIIPDNLRFYGEVAAWPQQWDKSGNDVWVPIEAAGVLRRLGQGAKPLHSALYREIMSRANIGTLFYAPTGLLAYWPCEDESGATSIASAIGGPAMNISGTPELAAYTPIAASAPISNMGTAAFNGTVPKSALTGELLIRVHAAFPTGGATSGQIFGVRTTGTANLWVVDYVSGSGGQCILRVYDTEGAELHNSGNVSAALDGAESNFSLALTQNGSDADYQLRVWRVAANGTVSAQTLTTGTVTGRSVGRAVRVSAAYHQNQTDTAIGHIAVADDTAFFSGLNDAIAGWRGETAGRRIARLCGEEGVAFTQFGDLDDTAAMGPQLIKTFLELVRETADADLGILYEPRHCFGLAYRTRTSLYNQAPALELDYTDGVFSQIPEPVADDQLTRNDVTVQRPGGSSARAVLDTGALSVQEPPDGIGPYDTSEDVNVVGDEFLDNQASWRLALGTVDEARYPRLALHLHRPSYAADTALVAATHAVDLGDRVDVDNLPDWVDVNLVGQMAQGFRERLSSVLHDIEIIASPYSPFAVAEYEAAVGGPYRYDTAGSSLTSNFVAGTDTSMSVTVSVKPLWTTVGGEFPFDIECGGVRLTVTAISGASSPQTFTITQAPVNGIVKTIPAGTSVSLWTKARYAL